MDEIERQELEVAIIAALRPVGLAGRLRGRLGRGGRTVKQIAALLPDAVRPRALDADARGTGVAAERQALDDLRGVLLDMAQRGRLRRRRVSGQYFLNTKGNRLVEVDVFLLPPGGQ